MQFETFKKKPFYLSDSDIEWVKTTFAGMSEADKIGQLFFLILYGPDKALIEKFTHQIKAGGIMCRAMNDEDLAESIRQMQSGSSIPALIAANLEAGGNGICLQGTKIGSQMMVAATNDPKNAAVLGAVCADEAVAVGANYAFAPVVDIDYNFRNPITNTRTYGSDPETVLSFAREYLKACQQRDVACSIKHFPGDGRDERDQHLCTTVNDLSVEEWDKTYGKIYRTLIEDGAKTVMVGHIMQPAYSRMLVPGIRDEEIMPATLAPELLQGLLRERLGFNGLIITDATTMAGFDAAMEREKSVPYAIAAGCDMFLFSKNLDEDYAFMKQGVEDGIITRERLDEAVLRILALKASLQLHRKNNLPSLEHMRQVLGCPAHRDAARAIADDSITLVKNRENVLPISPQKTKRILIYDIESGENAIGYARSSGVYESLAPLLEKEGFTVTRFVPAPGNEGKTVRYSDMTGGYDLMIYVCNLATKSNQTTVRIEWLNPMGVNVPRYVEGVPTIFISTENPYHLLDVPMVKTYINTYGINDSTMPLLVEKLMGRSEFKGVSPVDPFCGKWDARR
ncbi:MAG: glycoside hydrolase family 3 protein [Faecousia sp.]